MAIVGIVCGTPAKYCNGNTIQATKALMGNKVHANHKEAFKCYAKYLVEIEGYKQIGNREFLDPNGGIRVLTKKSRFGGELRSGKRGDAGTSKRGVPRKQLGGIIISK